MNPWLGYFCVGILSALWLTSCDGDSQDERLYLPSGDPAAGLVAFRTLGCSDCHAIADRTIERKTPDPSIFVVLGGATTRVKGYPELMASIINPDHRFTRGSDPRTINASGESRMPNYNAVMTVQQLVDVVEFLKPTYYVWTPKYTKQFIKQ